MDEAAACVGVSDVSPLNACDARCCPAKGFWQFLTSSCSFCLGACRWKECESGVWREQAGADGWRRCYKKALPLEVLRPQQRLSGLEKDAQKGEENQTAPLWWQIGGCGVSACWQTRSLVRGPGLTCSSAGKFLLPGSKGKPPTLRTPRDLVSSSQLLNNLIYAICGDGCKRCTDLHENSMAPGVCKPWKASQIPAGFACLPRCVDTTGRTPIPIFVSYALELVKAFW